MAETTTKLEQKSDTQSWDMLQGYSFKKPLKDMNKENINDSNGTIYPDKKRNSIFIDKTHKKDNNNINNNKCNKDFNRMVRMIDGFKFDEINKETLQSMVDTIKEMNLTPIYTDKLWYKKLNEYLSNPININDNNNNDSETKSNDKPIIVSHSHTDSSTTWSTMVSDTKSETTKDKEFMDIINKNKWYFPEPTNIELDYFKLCDHNSYIKINPIIGIDLFDDIIPFMIDNNSIISDETNNADIISNETDSWLMDFNDDITNIDSDTLSCNNIFQISREYIAKHL